MFEKIKKLIENKLNISADKITLKSKLNEDLGIDSLDAVELLMALEEEFGITVDDKAAQSFNSVADIVSYVEKIS